ncbi:unnamed protein product [Rotaria sordida]|uniref:DNA-(apurinic or apyrimidinic site) lyase n=1 Tax=Rotaria sordida TaxID=392033 RepID=A0A815P5T7_9BILA|nr:unnamed protein product [Rotaria sordida]CAF1444517.1 unnamed protein product [Rotaria sordida]
MSLLKFIPSTSTLSDNLIIYSTGSIPIITKELNLKQTLLGGQSFRWIEQNSNEFIGVLGTYIVRLQHQNNNLRYTFFINNDNLIKLSNDNDRRVETALILHNYFQLKIKLCELFDKWCKSDMRFEKGQIPIGIRVLAQEPLENLISFICSSNNNVQRISKMIKVFCDEYGKKIGTLNGITYHQFPTLDELDIPDLEKRLRELNFGYRARYIQEAVKFLKYTAGGTLFFDRLKTLSVKEARNQLSKMMGVGRKVADCVLLMSLGKQDVVPVDTHIHSIAMTHYGHYNENVKKQQLTTANYNDISSFFEQFWQPLSGWAQAAAFSNELRLSSTPRNSVKSSVLSLKRSISSQDILTEKLFKTIDENNQCQSIKITMKRDKLRQKNLLTIEPNKEILTRPKRNIKPIDRF